MPYTVWVVGPDDQAPHEVGTFARVEDAVAMLSALMRAEVVGPRMVGIEGSGGPAGPAHPLAHPAPARGAPAAPAPGAPAAPAALRTAAQRRAGTQPPPAGD